MSNGLVAWVTGGSRGIGRAVVERLQRDGYRVASSATSPESAARSSPDLALGCDVASPTDVRAATERVLDALGRLDVVVNNAGVAGHNPLGPSDDDTEWHRVIDVNLHGTYYVCKHALAHLPDGRGRIINVASVLGLRGVPDQTAYCAAKHGVVGLTRSLALHCAPRGITVNAVCPGWVATDMAAGRAQELDATPEELGRGVPLGRMATPREVAGLVAYVASEEAAMVTGQALTLDGGATA